MTSIPLTASRRRDPVLWLALGLLAVLVVLAVFAPVLTPYDPNAIDLDNRLSPLSGAHWLGTDHLGRDVLSRLMAGTRVSLGSVLVIAGLVLGTGFVVGSVSGWLGGWVDSLIMRVCEAFMTFPTFILAMFLTGVLGRGMTNVVLAIVLTHWAWYARITRGMVQAVKSREYIAAARLAGRREPGRHLHQAHCGAGPEPDAYPRHPGCRAHAPPRFRAVLPRPRHPAADAGVGRHD